MSAAKGGSGFDEVLHSDDGSRFIANIYIARGYVHIDFDRDAMFNLEDTIKIHAAIGGAILAMRGKSCP